MEIPQAGILFRTNEYILPGPQPYPAARETDGHPRPGADRPRIDVRISRLRRGWADAHSPAFIKTVYGAGYLFLATVTWSGDNA